MLVFQALQTGGGDVVFERRPRVALAEVLGVGAFLAFANLPWDFVYFTVPKIADPNTVTRYANDGAERMAGTPATDRARCARSRRKAAVKAQR